MKRETIIRLFMRLCAALPLRGAHALGAALGGLLAVVPGRIRTITHRNVELCFPELSPSEQRRLASRSLRGTGRTVAETGALWHWPPDRVLSLVKAVDGREPVDAALRDGRGAILMTPHLGNWELVGLYCSTLYPLTSLYRPPRMKGLEEYMRGSRERFGARLVPTSAGGIRHLYRALGRGEFIGLLPDQEPQAGSGVFAPFFGVDAYTMTLLPRLLEKYEVPVFFVHSERLPRGAGFRIHFSPMTSDFRRDDTVSVCTAMNAGVEACVRRAPEQYQWNYKRFRTRPDGMSPRY
ncbi:MAG: lysophospholipid acyltransferase family protein [Gammaproteobacteria bacterium]|nr:lysophospholipid acyltransferase family protein [Gammaproteobacteria bacterium]